MAPTSKLRGYVIAINEDQNYASVYFKDSPKTELFLDLEPNFVNTLKVGNEIEFYKPDDFEPNNCFSPQKVGVQLWDGCRKTVIPEKPTKFSQIQFSTNAIFTTDVLDDGALQEEEVVAVGYSENFGRFVVTADFEDTSVTFEKSKLYRVLIGRYPKKASTARFNRWGTVLVCEKVISIGDEEEHRMINSLQEKCPWSQNLVPVKLPPKVSSSYVVKRPLRTIAPKDAFFEDSNGLLIPFALIVERSEQHTLIFSPDHQSFYYVSSNFTDLEPGSICGLKLSNEVDGIFQKCSANKTFLNMPASVRMISSGIIEAIFDVELSQFSGAEFPPPWSSICGDSKYLGKVLIPESDSLPSHGTIVKVRAIFLNRPVGEYCWIITELLGEVNVNANKPADQECSTSFTVPATDSNTATPTQQASPESKDSSGAKTPQIPELDQSIVKKFSHFELNGVSARSKNNYNSRVRSHDTDSESGEILSESEDDEKNGASEHTVNFATLNDSDPDNASANMGFGNGCIQDKCDTADEMDNSGDKERATVQELSDTDLAEPSKPFDAYKQQNSSDTENESDSDAKFGIGEEEVVSDAVVSSEVYNQFVSDEEQSDQGDKKIESTSNQMPTFNSQVHSLDDTAFGRFGRNNVYAEEIGRLMKDPNWKYCMVSDEEEDNISIDGGSNLSFIVDDTLEQKSEEPSIADQHESDADQHESDADQHETDADQHETDADQHETDADQQPSSSSKDDSNSEDDNYDHGFASNPNKFTKNLPPSKSGQEKPSKAKSNEDTTCDSQSSVCSTESDDD